VSANEKNRRACGDYGMMHRSLEAVDSKKILDIVATLWPTVVRHYSPLCTVHCDVHYFRLFLSHKVSGFEFCYGRVRHTTTDGSGVKAVA
jgi:hypothetical protein